MRKVALLFALATTAAAALAWWETQELAETRTELAVAGGHLQKARADLQGAQTELAALRKEAAAGQFTLQQMQADLTTARNFLEAERAANTRLRDDMAKTKELLAAAMSRRPAAPAARSGPTSVGAASPAR
jgi:septal ring factor EnvC (AmiA/AmiB activator)